MNEICEMLKEKLDKMRNEHDTTVVLDFAEVAKLYQVVCFMMQIKKIANGWD